MGVLTKEQATTFERTSSINDQLLRSILKCSCNPYADVFTFNRWKAQRMSVSKGEHGIRLPLIKVVEEKDPDGKHLALGTGR